MLDIAKINPVLTSSSDVANYTFVTADNILYLVSNTLSGDDCGKEDMVIKAGDFLNGYEVKAFEGKKLVVDEKHIAYGSSQSYASLTNGTKLKVNADGKLEITNSAPTSGVYFVVSDKCTLTEKAVKVLVVVVDETASA